MTTTEHRNTTTPMPTGVGRTGAVLLILAPLVMALGRVLLVPFDDQAWDKTLSNMAAHQGRSDFGWILAVVASGLLATTAAILANQLRGRRARTATFAVIATAVGWSGTAGIAVGGLFMSSMAKAPDRAAQVQILKDFNDGNSAFVFLLCAIAAIGYVALAIGLARSKVTSKGAAILIGLGGATTLLTMPGPLTPLLVATALVLAAGHSLAVRSLGRTGAA